MEKLSEKLPKEFVLRLKDSLGEKINDYLTAIDEPSVRGVRVNTKKVSADKVKEIFEKEFSVKIKSIDYADDGFILDSDIKVGNEPSHLAGFYYFQEPSSMIPVVSSKIEEETRPLKVLDLCASPGGKTGHG